MSLLRWAASQWCAACCDGEIECAAWCRVAAAAVVVLPWICAPHCPRGAGGVQTLARRLLRPELPPRAASSLPFLLLADFAQIADFLHEVLEECKATQRKSGKKLTDFTQCVSSGLQGPFVVWGTDVTTHAQHGAPCMAGSACTAGAAGSRSSAGAHAARHAQPARSCDVWSSSERRQAAAGCVHAPSRPPLHPPPTLRRSCLQHHSEQPGDCQHPAARGGVGRQLPHARL
mgnify:CR=1 FL=1